jgi:hypothetical protein
MPGAVQRDAHYHAIELAAAPAQRVVRPAVERKGHGSDGLHRQLIGQPALDPGHV